MDDQGDSTLILARMILVGHLDDGSHEFKSNEGLELKAIDTGPDLGDSITPWPRALSRETNLESEI
jgi:hypothetical protein